MLLADYHPIKSIWAFLYFLALLIFISIYKSSFTLTDMFWNKSFELKTVFEKYKDYLFWFVDINKRIETCGPSNSEIMWFQLDMFILLSLYVYDEKISTGVLAVIFLQQRLWFWISPAMLPSFPQEIMQEIFQEVYSLHLGHEDSPVNWSWRLPSLIDHEDSPVNWSWRLWSRF